MKMMASILTNIGHSSSPNRFTNPVTHNLFTFFAVHLFVCLYRYKLLVTYCIQWIILQKKKNSKGWCTVIVQENAWAQGKMIV